MLTISLVEVFTFRFGLHYEHFHFAISLEKCYIVFSQQNPGELAANKSPYLVKTEFLCKL